MTETIAHTRLYYAPGACSLAPLIALHEAGAAFEARKVHLAAGEQLHASYLAINPHGRIPALVLGGTVVTEVIGILTWIAARYPDAGLLPFDDAVLLGRAYEIMSWYASTLHVAIAQIWRAGRFTADQLAWPGLREAGLATLRGGFSEIDSALRGAWALGDRYSVVDAYTLVFWRWAERLQIDMAAYPNWSLHTARMFGRDAVAAALATERGAAA